MINMFEISQNLITFNNYIFVFQGFEFIIFLIFFLGFGLMKIKNHASNRMCRTNLI